MIYFDNAATSRFKPKSVRKAIDRHLKRSANPGRAAHKDAIKESIMVEQARSFLLDKLGATDDYELVFTKNCTEALNLAIFGTAMSGKRVITTALEHNSVLRPLFKLKDENVISLSVLNPDRYGQINPELLDRMITPDTYMVAITAQSNVTGQVTDVKAVGEVCKKHGVMLLLDAAQAIPLLDVDMKSMNVSMLAAPGHKGLHGPQGTGFLAFRSDIKIKPLLYGGTGTDSDSVYMPKSPPESLEAGTVNACGIAALLAGARWSYAHAEATKYHVAKLSKQIIDGLKTIPKVTLYTDENCLSGVISFNVKGFDSNEVGDILSRKFNVAVRTGLHCAPLVHNHLGTLDIGAIRVSVGADNTEKDVCKLIAAVKKVAEKA